MLTLYVYVRTWLDSLMPEDGQDLVEYALLVALIALVCIVAITAGGTAIQNVWNAIAARLDGAIPAAP